MSTAVCPSERCRHLHIKGRRNVWSKNFVDVNDIQVLKKKSHKGETNNLSTDADNSTDTTVGWTKNNPKPFFFLRKKSSKMQKLKNV